MKQNILFISVAIILLLVSCGPSKEEAIEYNDKITTEQSAIVQEEDALINVISNNEQEKIELFYKNFLAQIDSSKKKIEELEKHPKFDAFNKAALSFFTSYKEVATNQYSEIIKITMLPDEEYTPEADNKVLSLVEQIDNILKKVFDNFSAEQEKFAKKFNLVPESSNGINE